MTKPENTLEIWPYHTGLTVSDLERSIKFYNRLGFEVIATAERDQPDISEVVGLENTHLKLAQLKAPGSEHVLELLQYFTPEGEPIDTTPCNVGTAHFAFFVSDIDSMYLRLLEGGVTCRSPRPVPLSAGANPGGKALYFSDPDGFVLELLQPPITSKA